MKPTGQDETVVRLEIAPRHPRVAPGRGGGRVAGPPALVLGALLASANLSIIATDEEGLIQLFNPGAETMLGYAAVEVVDRITPAELHDPQEVIERARALSEELATPVAPGFEALAFKASRGIEDRYELTCVRKDGRRFPATVSVTALRDAGARVVGYLLVGTDDSARRSVEERLRQAEETSTRADAAVAKANLARSDFLSSMSHELRSPLNAILGFAQLMESDTDAVSASQRGALAEILRAGWHLLALIDGTLELAQLGAGERSRQDPPAAADPAVPRRGS